MHSLDACGIENLSAIRNSRVFAFQVLHVHVQHVSGAHESLRIAKKEHSE